MKNDRFKQICHFAAGVILMPFAFKLFEQKSFLYSAIILVFGILFLIVSGSQEWLEKKLGDVIKLFFLLESITFLFCSYINFEKGKLMPTYGYALAGGVFFLLFLYFLYKKDRSKKHHKKHRHHHSSGGHHSHRKHHSSSDKEEDNIVN